MKQDLKDLFIIALETLREIAERPDYLYSGARNAVVTLEKELGWMEREGKEEKHGEK